MADTLTANYSITKVQVGASEDSWGDKINANWDKVDGLLDGLDDRLEGIDSLLTGSTALDSIRLALGSATDLPLAFFGDSNTGFYSPEANTIVLMTEGHEALRISSDQKTSLGTIVTDARLNIQAYSNDDRCISLRGKNADRGGYIGTTGSGSATRIKIDADRGDGGIDVHVAGAKICTIDERGFNLIAPNGTQYRLSVDNSGNLSTTAI